MTTSKLNEITEAIMVQRLAQCAFYHGLLQSVLDTAQALAERFTEDDMRILVAAHERIPVSDLEQIDVAPIEPADELHDYGYCPPTSYARLLAGELCLCCYVGSDIWFPAPTTGEEIERAEGLMDRLRDFTPEESLALHVVIEASRVVVCGTIAHPNWWYPQVLAGLLNNPHLDRLSHHV